MTRNIRTLRLLFWLLLGLIIIAYLLPPRGQWSSYLPPVCTVKDIDPFNSKVMGFIYDPGEHNCSGDYNLQIKIDSNGLRLLNTNIYSVHVREIFEDKKKGFIYGKPVHLMGLNKENVDLSRNFRGFIKNIGNTVCISPSDYDRQSPPAEIHVIFSRHCTSSQSIFNFTHDGHIKHDLSKRCLGPKGGSSQPVSGTTLVLSDYCGAVFEVLRGGVIKLVGTSSCVHPLGGVVRAGAKVCLWPSCDNEKRLRYAGVASADNENVHEKKSLKLLSEMNQVEVEFANGNVVRTHYLNFTPKSLPDTPSQQTPNIVVIAIDKASAAHFNRQLSSTVRFLSEIDVIKYSKFAAVSSSVTENLMAILSGKSRSDLIEASIFSLAKKNSYVTMLLDDEPKGLSPLFSKDEIDKDPSPFFRAVQQESHVHFKKFCANDQGIYNITFDYLSSFLKAYHSHPKLAVIRLSQISNYDINYLKYMDKGFTSLLRNIQPFKNTVVFLNTLVGKDARIFGWLEEGIYEQKRPFLSIHVSNDIKGLYNLEPERLSQLTTPFDVYLTLRHLITRKEHKFHFGRSLLHGYKDRNCTEAGIDTAMCPCE